MADTPEPLEKLVKVFDTDVESEAMVVQGLLESAGIEAVISNREAPQDVLPGVGGVVILVREEQAQRGGRDDPGVQQASHYGRRRRGQRGTG